MLAKELQPNDRYIIIASDGVFEFLSSQTVMDMAAKFDDPLEASRAIVAEACKLWLFHEVRTDDITCIVIKLRGGMFADRGMSSATPAHMRRSIKESSRSLLDKSGRGFKTVLASQSSRPVRRMMSRLKRKMIMEQADVDDADDSDDAEEDGTVADTPRHAKSSKESAEIEMAVKANFLFSHLNESQKKVLFDAFYKISVSSGETIIKQGDKGDRFYVVRSGVYECFVRKAGESLAATIESSSSPFGTLVHTYRASADNLLGNPSFGELALMYGKPRAATVVATEDGELWALDRKTFKSCLMKTSSSKLVKTLQSVEVLSSLSKSQLRRLPDILTEVKYKNGDIIIRQGDEGDSFYVILKEVLIARSTLYLTKRTGSWLQRTRAKLFSPSRGSYFEERALLKSDKRAANVIACDSQVVCLYISRRAFEEVLGPLSDLIEADGKKREAQAMSISHMKSKKTKEGLDGSSFADFEQLTELLEVGSYGHVWAVRNKSSGKLYMLRSCDKKKVESVKQEKVVVRNRNMLLEVAVREVRRQSSAVRFVPNVVCTFNGAFGVHILYKDAMCGNVQGFMEGFQDRPEKVEAAKFVCACAALMMIDMHDDLILLRGINAEMMMIDTNGYVRLPDLSFAKTLGDINDKTYTMCGAAEYMSPRASAERGPRLEEGGLVVTRRVLAYEFLVGTSPFSDAGNEGALYKAITSLDTGSLSFPGDVPDEAADFCRRLLDPTRAPAWAPPK